MAHLKLLPGLHHGRKAKNKRHGISSDQLRNAKANRAYEKKINTIKHEIMIQKYGIWTNED